MLSNRGKSKAAILTIIAITLLPLTNIKALAQTPSDRLTISQCADVEIEKHIEQLGNGEPSAFDALVACNSQAVPALIKALENQDEGARIITIAALGQIGSQAAPAVPSLNQLLKDISTDVRFVVVHALRQIGKDAIPALITALNDKNMDIQDSATTALVQMGEGAVPALIIALQEPNSNVRSRAADALERIGAEAKVAVPALISALQEPNSDVHSNTVNVLGQMGTETKAAVPALISALQDPNSDVRSNTVNVLGQMGTEAKAAVPALIATLQDADSGIRSGAAYALGKMGTEAKAAVPALTAALQHEDENTNFSAAVALVKVGGSPQDAIPVLIANLQGAQGLEEHQNCNRFIRISTETLGEIGRRAVPALTIALKDRDWSVRFGAIRAFGKIGAEAKDAVSELTEVFLDSDEDKVVRYEAIQALKNIASDEAISVLETHREIAITISQDISQEVQEVPMRVRGACTVSPTRAVKLAATNHVSSRPPAMCRIRPIRAVLRWKCP